MKEVQRYFIELAYDGTAYHGWQRQPDAVSVQSKVEEGLSLLLRTPIEVVAAGRTDAGVHATQMWVHADIPISISLDNFIFKINRWLPDDISIFRMLKAAPTAHARFDATARSYEYHFHLRPDPFQKNRSYLLYRRPDIDLMQQAAAILLDYKDFECFSRSQSDVRTYLCDITQADFELQGEHLVFHITANRFLRNMVRAIVGTLLDIGYGKIAVDDIHDIIASKNRSNAGASAPAYGLYLTKILYPEGTYEG